MNKLYLVPGRHDLSLEATPRPTHEFKALFTNRNAKEIELLWKQYLSWRKNRLDIGIHEFSRQRSMCMQKAAADMEKLENPLRNGKKGENYSCSFLLPESVKKFSVRGLEDSGLNVSRDNLKPNFVTIYGVPREAGELQIKILYLGAEYPADIGQKTFNLQINPDPRDLWKDLPCDPELEYFKPATDGARLVADDVLLVGASRRGRSHAHAGLARDDDFAIGESNGWSILMVADGAGSAEYSREGARLACEAAMNVCQRKAARGEKLDEFFSQNARNFTSDSDLLAVARKTVYDVLPGAAFQAYSTITKEAKEKGRPARSYATTLLMAMAKRFSPGWVVVSWQVGDGAMAAITSQDSFSSILLAEPDEGEYGGQTRFITMREMFEPNELMRRIRVDLVPDLAGLVLMTDGISDAWFATLANLHSAERWQTFWREILPLAQSGDPVTGLLEWMTFWSQGNHDDRTLALMLPLGECWNEQ